MLGTPITRDINVAQQVCCTFPDNSWAAVTAIVKPFIDAAPAGIVRSNEHRTDPTFRLVRSRGVSDSRAVFARAVACR